MKLFFLKDYLDTNNLFEQGSVYNLDDNLSLSMIKKGYATEYKGIISEKSNILKLEIKNSELKAHQKLFLKKLKLSFYFWFFVGSVWIIFPFIPLSFLGFDQNTLLGFTFLSPTTGFISFFAIFFMSCQLIFMFSSIYFLITKTKLSEKFLKIYSYFCFNFLTPLMININDKEIKKLEANIKKDKKIYDKYTTQEIKLDYRKLNANTRY